MAIVKDVSPQCKVVVYQWTKVDPTEGDSSSALSASKPLDVSSRLLSFEYSKNMSSPAGSFSFRLANNTGLPESDWKQIIRRGTWCLIYLSQDGDLELRQNPSTPKPTDPKKLRCMGFVETVRVVTERSATEGFDVVYEVSGKDFGIVYTDSEIWNDRFRSEDSQNFMEAAGGQINVTANLSVDKIMKVVHDLLYNPAAIPGAVIKDDESIAASGRQWLLPEAMLKDLNIKKFTGQSSFWGAIPGTTKFSETAFSLGIANPISSLAGNTWENLKGIAIPQFHELYTELNDSGFPEIIFRPIPWMKKEVNLSISKFVTKYLDVPTIKVDSIDIDNFSLGEDVHHVYNSFLVILSSALISDSDNTSLLMNEGGDFTFPLHNHASIKRYGFRRMHVEVNGLINNAVKDNGTPNLKLLKEFNKLLVDYWNNLEFAETGTLDKLGTNDVKVGKCMEFGPDVPYTANRRYYIEGYTDSYSLNDKGAAMWVQSLNLTHGFEKSDLLNNANYANRDEPFIQEGEYTSGSKEE